MAAPLTLVLGGGADARTVRSALVDMTALGMIDRFLWAETRAGGRGSDPVLDDVRHSRDSGLGIVTEKLSRVLANDGGRDVLLVVLDMADDAEHDDGNVRDWRSRLNDQLNTEVEILHLYVPHVGSRPLTQYGDLPTLILSPEEAATPKDRTSPVAYPAAQHTASALASIAGLWRTSARSPFFEAATNHEITGAFGQAQLVRTFHNFSDATQAENALYHRVFTLDGNMPHPPFEANRRILDVGDNDDAVTRYADALMARHGQAFVSPRLPLEQPRGRKVNAWAAIMQFLGLFFRAVIGTPAEHVNELVVKGRSSLARGVQNLLYGSDSNIEVVLGQQSGRAPRPLSEVEASVENLHRDTGQGDDLNLSHQAALPQFWRAYTTAALTLVDGGSRSASNDKVPGPNHDGTPAIVDNVRFAVASNDDAFEGENKILRDNVGSHITETRIQPYDPYNARIYEASIDLASRNTRNTTVHKLKDDFRIWKQNAQRSFGWQIGERLFGKIEEAKGKLAQIRHDAMLVDQELQSMPDDTGRQKRLSRTLRIWFLVWFLIVALLVYLCVSHYNPERAWALVNIEFFTWQRTLFLSLFTTAIVLVIQMVVFARANKGIYDRMERRRALEANVQILARDAITANQEVARCLGSYHQFLAWSAIVGRVLSHPFGRDRVTTQAGRHPDSGLPDNTVVDSVELSDEQLNDYSAQVRDEIFTVGWANEALDRYLTAGINHARTGMVTQEESYRLYGQPGTNSQLSQIADACRAGELYAGTDVASEMWQHSLETVRRSSQTLGDNRGRLASVMAGISRGEQERPFSNAALSVMGTNNDASDVDESLTFAEASQGTETLSQSYTVVQYGVSADVRAFDTSGATQAVEEQEQVPHVPVFGDDPVTTPPVFGDGPETNNPFENPFGHPDQPQRPTDRPDFGGLM